MVMAMQIFGCSQMNKTTIRGTWEASQVSQIKGKDYKLSHYNYWEIDDEQITLKSFYIATENGITETRFSDSTEYMMYEWNNDNQLVIDDLIFDVKVTGKKMELKSRELEIQFERGNLSLF